MQDFPHHYHVNATAQVTGNVAINSGAMPPLASAPPAEFGGPGDQWSPEHLLMASVADCFALTFRAIAAASKLEWSDLTADAEGVLDRVERVTQFTAIAVKATLTVPAGVDEAKAQRILHKAEDACLITNSLSADTHLETAIIAAS
ncbi:osmotically inducible protein OsmC [Halioglobus sp. HI00S01]|uniref:OsmC family protein n=1 Tax=Halioglobus sp. HI00S01 TaxID=1822214 RepID=UPI0007C36D33|nr:OsmC family protein [Halioglobus sp. HI00S01]KZX56923.1 osmotically inducible protein OsmC [Halioglobus sp. HI00S01]